jgi:hypothetical protein
VNLHGLEGWLHGEALDALNEDVLLALLGSHSLSFATLTASATTLTHLSSMNLASDLLSCVLCWFGLSAHQFALIIISHHLKHYF